MAQPKCRRGRGGREMKNRVKGAAGLVILALCPAWRLAAQNPVPARIVLSSPGALPEHRPGPGRVVREIDDPHTGDRWLLVSGAGLPGGPGRLVLAASSPASSALSRPASSAAPEPERSAQPLPVIHTGDRLILEEDTPLVRARLEARALSPALAGSPLMVRLVLGGAVMRAVALGPGRAAFASPSGVRP